VPSRHDGKIVTARSALSAVVGKITAKIEHSVLLHRDGKIAAEIEENLSSRVIIQMQQIFIRQ